MRMIAIAGTAGGKLCDGTGTLLVEVTLKSCLIAVEPCLCY